MFCAQEREYQRHALHQFALFLCTVPYQNPSIPTWWLHRVEVTQALVSWLSLTGVFSSMQTDQEALLPIPVSTEKRPEPRLALTIGVAGWIAEPKDFGEALCCHTVVEKASYRFYALCMQQDHLAELF